jgi:hypothetical protein
VAAVAGEINPGGLSIRIPENGYIVGYRQVSRYPCHDIAAHISQNGFSAEGTLVDFSPLGFRIQVTPDPEDFFRKYNPEFSANLILQNDTRTLFSEPCALVRRARDSGFNDIVLCPQHDRIQRFKRRDIRNLRQCLLPSPTISFRHPFHGRKVRLKVTDISTSGFSVQEYTPRSVLVPGMIIPDLTIHFPGNLRMPCQAQVIYRAGTDENEVRCGITILDMDVDTYSRFSDIMINAMEPNAQVANDVDLEDLWEFFFDAGFIYPKKYKHIQGRREAFRETYRKLYTESTEVAKHFTYQRHGRIEGHISMVRVYEKTWMIHHHAARRKSGLQVGLRVLKQIMVFLNDMHRLPSTHMDYALCCYRPGSRFPDRAFGAFARLLDDPRACSVDLFSYLPFPRMSVEKPLGEGWELKEASPHDLWELKRFYMFTSKGLMLDAMNLEEKASLGESIEEVFHRLGFRRTIRVHALTHKDHMKAVLIINQSDVGFNLSELLNSITVLVTEPETLPWEALSTAISRLSVLYKDLAMVPVLIYPKAFAESKGVSIDRDYQLWILHVDFGSEYIKYIQNSLKVNFSEDNDRHERNSDAPKPPL